MQKYKICPSCHTKNAPTLFECLACEADLTGVKITDEATERMLEEKESSQHDTPEKPGMVRLCDCGGKNPANARKCGVCGEDISDVMPVPDTAPAEAPKPLSYVLSSLDGQYAFKVTAQEMIIGRENEMSGYLAAKSYVSRAHARITVEEGALCVENLSTTNYTFVNHVKILEKTTLADGDELGLGGACINGARQADAAYFLVRIGSCM